MGQESSITGPYSLNGDGLAAGNQGGGLGAVGGVLSDLDSGVLLGTLISARVDSGNGSAGQEGGSSSEGELHFG